MLLETSIPQPMLLRALTELLHGKGSHVDPIACIEDLPAELAARYITGFPHSIGQLVFHMNFWMDYDLRRIRGEKPPYPQHNAESFPDRTTPKDSKEWNELRERFAALLKETAAFADATPAELAREVEPTHPSHKERASTVEAGLWQLVAHNSYHVGQIAMLRRILGVWPPRSGGDTW
jgi:uncharacterized damage-inducible protein DinB